MSEKNKHQGYKKAHGFRSSGSLDLGSHVPEPLFSITAHPAWDTLQFEGDRIEFRNRTVKVKGFTVKEFLERFNSLVFIDEDGQKVTFKKEES